MSPSQSQALKQKALELEEASEDSTKGEAEIGRLALEAAKLHFQLAKDLNEPPDPTRGNLPDPNSHVNRAFLLIKRAKAMASHGQLKWGPEEQLLQDEIDKLHSKDVKVQPMLGNQIGQSEDYERIQRIKDKGLPESMFGGKKMSIVKIAEEGWPKKLEKGRFTEYCGGEVTLECAKRALKSDDASVRGMAMFWGNTNKPAGWEALLSEVKGGGKKEASKKEKKDDKKEVEHGGAKSPWAVCYHSLGLDHKPDPESEIGKKFERCVMDVKKESSSKWSITKKSSTPWSMTKESQQALPSSALPTAPASPSPATPAPNAAGDQVMADPMAGKPIGGMTLMTPDGKPMGNLPTLADAQRKAKEILQGKPDLLSLNIVGPDGMVIEPVTRNK